MPGCFVIGIQDFVVVQSADALKAAALNREQAVEADPTLGMSRSELSRRGLTRSDRPTPPPPPETLVSFDTVPSTHSKKNKASMKSDKLKPASGLGCIDDAHTTYKTAYSAVVEVIDVAGFFFFLRDHLLRGVSTPYVRLRGGPVLTHDEPTTQKGAGRRLVVC